MTMTAYLQCRWSPKVWVAIVPVATHISLCLSVPLVPSASCCHNMVLCACRWHCRCCCRCRIIYTLICSFCEHSGRYSLADKTPGLIKSSRPQARFFLTRHNCIPFNGCYSHLYLLCHTQKFSATNSCCCSVCQRLRISLIFMIVFSILYTPIAVE